MANRKSGSTDSIRIAVYPDSQLMERLDTWCKEQGLDRNAGMRHIMRTMLNVQDDSPETRLKNCVDILEAQVGRWSAVNLGA